MLVQLNKFIVPADFIILNMEEDPETPLILGRPFLATCDATLCMRDSSIEFSINGEQVKSNMEHVVKSPNERAEIHMVDVVDECIEEEISNWLHEYLGLDAKWLSQSSLEDVEVDEFLTLKEKESSILSIST